MQNWSPTWDLWNSPGSYKGQKLVHTSQAGTVNNYLYPVDLVVNYCNLKLQTAYNATLVGTYLT